MLTRVRRTNSTSHVEIPIKTTPMEGKISDQEINALKAKIELIDVALKHLSVRADMALNVISALTSALGGTKTDVYREIAIKVVNDFSYKNIKGYEKILSDEKQHVLNCIESVALPESD